MIAACWAEMWSLAMFSKVHNNMSWSDLWCCWHLFWVDAFSQMPIRLEAWTPPMNDGSGVEGLSNFTELPLSFTSFLKSQAGGQAFSHQGLLELFAEECARCSQAVGHNMLILNSLEPGNRNERRGLLCLAQLALRGRGARSASQLAIQIARTNSFILSYCWAEPRAPYGDSWPTSDVAGSESHGKQRFISLRAPSRMRV